MSPDACKHTEPDDHVPEELDLREGAVLEGLENLLVVGTAEHHAYPRALQRRVLRQQWPLVAVSCARYVPALPCAACHARGPASFSTTSLNPRVVSSTLLALSRL